MSTSVSTSHRIRWIANRRRGADRVAAGLFRVIRVLNTRKDLERQLAAILRGLGLAGG